MKAVNHQRGSIKPHVGTGFRSVSRWGNQGQVISLFPRPLGGSIKRPTWGSPTELWLGTKKQTIFVLPQPGPNSAKAAWWGVASRALGVPLCEWGGLSGPTAELLRRPRDSVARKEPGAYYDTPSNPSALPTPSTGQSLKKTKKTLCTESKAEKRGRKT